MLVPIGSPMVLDITLFVRVTVGMLRHIIIMGLNVYHRYQLCHSHIKSILKGSFSIMCVNKVLELELLVTVIQ